jgi:hypothetical protein
VEDERSCRPRSYRDDESVKIVRHLVLSDKLLKIRAIAVERNSEKA